MSSQLDSPILKELAKMIADFRVAKSLDGGFSSNYSMYASYYYESFTYAIKQLSARDKILKQVLAASFRNLRHTI